MSPIRRLRPPSEQYWFGTDMLGRDVYSRVVYGARVSLVVGLSVALLSTLGGLAIGLVAGYSRPVDAVVMRFMDGLMSIPPVLLAIALMALTRASLENVVVAISIAEIPRVTRLVRGLVLSLREQPFVEAAVACGTPFVPILLRCLRRRQPAAPQPAILASSDAAEAREPNSATARALAAEPSLERKSGSAARLASAAAKAGASP